MKKLFILLLLVLISGCANFNTMMNENVFIKTNNGTYIIFDSMLEKSFCTKSTLDNFMLDYSQDAIIEEFALNSNNKNIFDSIEKNKINTKLDNCQYDFYIQTTNTNFNYSVLNTMDFKANDELDIIKLLKNGEFNDFQNNKTTSVNDNTIKTLLKIKNNDTLSNSYLKVSEDGKYEIRAYIKFSNIEFIDKNQIYDQNIMVISGIKFDLVKIK